MDNRVNLALRTKIADTESSKVQLERQLEEVCAEVSKREEAIRRLESDLEEHRAPIAVNRECQSYRAQRPRSEAYSDPVALSLEYEAAVLQQTSMQIERRLQRASRELNHLCELKRRLQDEISTKGRMLEIDSRLLVLRQSS